MRDEKQKYYFSMINIIKGLQDDFDSNEVNEEAKGLLSELLNLCNDEYSDRFGDN
jgi:hypothetical protein